MVDEELGLERTVQPLEQRVVHRRAGKAELAHARHVGRGEGRVGQHVVVQGRHEVEMRHPLVLDRRERHRRSNFGRQTRRPSTSAIASSERTPIV